MRLHLWRFILDPVTSVRAVRRLAASRGQTSFDVAWRQVRVERFPDEAPYQRHGHAPPGADRKQPENVHRPDRWPN